MQAALRLVKAYTVGVTVNEVLNLLVKVLFRVLVKRSVVVVGEVVCVALPYNVVTLSTVENAVAVLSRVASRVTISKSGSLAASTGPGDIALLTIPIRRVILGTGDGGLIRDTVSLSL